MENENRNAEKEKSWERLHGLLDLQQELETLFGDTGYNVFVFGSYVTTRFVEGKSDIDIGVYAEDFDLYKRLSSYLERYFEERGVPSDIFFIDTSLAAPVYSAALKAKVQLTDYFPEKLKVFQQKCQMELDAVRARMVI